MKKQQANTTQANTRSANVPGTAQPEAEKQQPKSAEQVAADKAAAEKEMDRIKGIELRGHEEAKSMILKDKDHALTQVELWKKVAQFETEAEAVSFVKGFRDECETEAAEGGETADSAGRIGRNVSIMRRVIRAVFGWKQKQDDKTSKRVFHDEPFSDDVEDNRAEVMKILNGPGTWASKAGLLPKLEGMGRPEDAESGGGETDQYRRTISAADKINPAKGDASVLANVMRVPSKVDGEDVPEEERNEKAIDGLRAALKALPEDKTPIIIEDVIGKALISSVKWQQEWAIGARDLYNKVIGAAGTDKVQVRRTAGAEVTND